MNAPREHIPAHYPTLLDRVRTTHRDELPPGQLEEWVHLGIDSALGLHRENGGWTVWELFRQRDRAPLKCGDFMNVAHARTYLRDRELRRRK